MNTKDIMIKEQTMSNLKTMLSEYQEEQTPYLAKAQKGHEQNFNVCLIYEG